MSNALEEKPFVKGLWGCRKRCWFSSLCISSVH